MKVNAESLPEIVIRLRSFIEVRPFTDVHKYVTDVHKRENVKVVCLACVQLKSSS